MTSPLRTFSRAKLGHEVTRYLREAIMSGAFRPGEKMGLDALARDLDVSTMPVREALLALTNEGLLEFRHNRGFRVAEITRTDIDDIFAVHALVAGTLAARAAEAMPPETLERLGDIQAELEQLPKRRMARARRAEVAENLNWRFHRIINRTPSDANRLRWFVLVTARFIPPQFYESIDGWLDGTLADHPAILQALRDRNAPEARRLMETHTRHAATCVIEHLDRIGLWDAPVVTPPRRAKGVGEIEQVAP